ncbi:hypothetical protein MRX96_048684 [Rhipicephalus microplus]
MRKFLGMILYMSVVSMPFRRMYWYRLLRRSHIADCMPRNRFDEVISLFHACSNDTEKKKEEDGYDKLYKVLPLLSRLNYNFRGAAEMEDCLAVDEMIAPFKGRHSLKVYMNKKPRKWGYKVWTLAGRSGYVYKIELYGDNLVIDPTDLSNDIGESGKVVVRLSEGCKGKEIFCDNFFASADLLVEMKRRGLGCTATMRNGRIGRCPLKTEKCLKGEGCGSFDFRSEKDSGIIICHWHDNLSVMIGSNTHSSGPAAFFLRNELKTKKWYKRIIFHLLDLAVVNSWLLYRAVKDSEIQLSEFKVQVAFGLMKSEKSHEAPLHDRTLTGNWLSNRASDVPTSVRYDGVNHLPVKVPQKSAAEKCPKVQATAVFTENKAPV